MGGGKTLTRKTIQEINPGNQSSRSFSEKDIGIHPRGQADSLICLAEEAFSMFVEKSSLGQWGTEVLVRAVPV